jgi:hypothetical protein
LADTQLVARDVKVPHLEIAEFGAAHAGVDERDQDGPVAQGSGAGERERPATLDRARRVLTAGGNESGNLVAGEGFNGWTAVVRLLHTADHIADVVLPLRPTPQRGECDPDVDGALGAQAEALLDIGEEAANVIRCDRLDGCVGAEEVEQAVEGEFVAGDGMRAESDLLVQPVTCDGIRETHIDPTSFRYPSLTIRAQMV